CPPRRRHHGFEWQTFCRYGRQREGASHRVLRHFFLRLIWTRRGVHPGRRTAREACLGRLPVPTKVGPSTTIPLLTEEGWTRHEEEVAKLPLMERTGWSLTDNTSECVFEG